MLFASHIVQETEVSDCLKEINPPHRHIQQTPFFSASASSASAVGLVGVIGTRTGDLFAVGIDSAWAEVQESQEGERSGGGSRMSRWSMSVLTFWS